MSLAMAFPTRYLDCFRIAMGVKTGMCMETPTQMEINDKRKVLFIALWPIMRVNRRCKWSGPAEDHVFDTNASSPEPNIIPDTTWKRTIACAARSRVRGIDSFLVLVANVQLRSMSCIDCVHTELHSAA